MFRARLLYVILRCVILVVFLEFSAAQLNQTVGDSCKLRSGGTGVCRDFKDCDLKLLQKEPKPAVCAWQGEDVIVCCPMSPKNVGNPCQLLSGGMGVCRDFDYCDLSLLVNEPSQPAICAWREEEPIICCPKSGKGRPGSPPRTGLSTAQQKCKEYNDIKQSVVPTILGGEEVKNVSQYPHMALLGYGNPPTFQCGGTLISDQYILTAAHCLFGNNRYPVTTAYLGFLNKTNMNEFNTFQEFSIVDTHKHPTRKAPKQYADIALLKLDRPVQYSLGVVPACLQEDYDIPVNEAQATGWGYSTIEARSGSDVLQRVQIPLVSYSECSSKYPSNRKIPQGILDETQFCAGDYGKDTCQGDSGGPLQIHDTSGMAKIIGITSFGQICGSVPGVYTRVSHYVPWIESIVWP